jgi:hypothetical protein
MLNRDLCFMKNLFILIGILMFTTAVTTDLAAQAAPKPRKSPLAISQFKSAKTYVRVIYSQPHKNDRVVFGGLVPMGKIWRLGANEATEFTTTQKIKIGGKTLAAGTYSVFAILNEDKWTLIFNSDLGLWGAYDYNSKADVLRLDIAVKPTSQTWEAFTIKLDKNGKDALMIISWDNTSVEVPIETFK